MGQEFTLTESQSVDDFEFKVIPEKTRVLCEVSDVVVRESFYADDAGNKKNEVSFKFKVVEGEYEGRVLFGRTPTTFTSHPDCKLRAWVLAILGVDDLPVGFTFDTDSLIGGFALVEVGHYQKTNADGTKSPRENAKTLLTVASDDSLMADNLF